MPGSARQAMDGGMVLAAHGAVVLAIDAPWARRGELPEGTIQDSVDQVALMRDLQRAVDVLLARADIDSLRLAYIGGSYGGAMGALFAGIEHRLKAFVLIVPDGGLVAHFTGADGSPCGPLLSLDSMARARWLAAMRPIEPIRFIGRATGALLIQNGRRDPLVTTGDAEALQAAAPAARMVRWYDGDHGLTPEARADRRAWLFPRLGLTP
jgi:dienelactone hydrolase